MTEAQAVSMFGALAQGTRLQIVRHLMTCGPVGASAGDVGALVDATSSRASFHLAALEKAGLVSSHRQSRHIIYRANIENLGNLASFLLNDCCGSHPDILACCGSPTQLS